MVPILKGIAAIVAAGTNVRIIDNLEGHALDLVNNLCTNFQPVQAANSGSGVATQQIVHSACNFPTTFAGSTSGAEALHAEAVIVNNSPTIFRIVPADPTIPSGPFNLIDTSSGLALTLWRYNPGTVLFAPSPIRGDARQAFSFVAA
ncbi:hypothetical protein C8J57DRAFT_1490014 [Mycena rebaudengoi]|nr:hypothetical protein C8J57DRAFT_1490014 [Mycena rebaudengoi]